VHDTSQGRICVMRMMVMMMMLLRLLLLLLMMMMLLLLHMSKSLESALQPSNLVH